MVVTEIQKDQLKEQKLRFIRTHQQPFDVEQIYPLRTFEDFVTEIEGDSTIEASCKIEVDKLIASRFMFFFQDKAKHWQKYLHQTLTFFSQVENRVGVQLNYSLLHEFLGDDFDFSKVTVLSAGIDLRKNLSASSVKIHIRIEDYPGKLEKAFALSDGVANSHYLSQFVSLIGFDFYFNGNSEIEIYAEVTEADYFKPETQNLVWRHFPSSVLTPLKASDLFLVGLSKANTNTVIYYHLKDRKTLSNYFKLNDTAQRVHNFYQHQAINPQMWIGTAQQELEKNRIENIRLYYYKSFIK